MRHDCVISPWSSRPSAVHTRQVLICFSPVSLGTMVDKPSAKVVCELLINDLRTHLINSNDNRRKRRVWVREWVKRRNVLGASNTICKELSIEDQGGYRNFLRMDPNMFSFLLNKVTATIQKSDTFMRRAIPAESKLHVTLRFLATGDSFSSLQYLFRIPKNTISKFVPEVLDAIYNALFDYIEVRTIFHYYFLFNSYIVHDGYAFSRCRKLKKTGRK